MENGRGKDEKIQGLLEAVQYPKNGSSRDRAQRKRRMYIRKLTDPEISPELKLQMKIDPHHGHSFIHSFVRQQILCPHLDFPVHAWGKRDLWSLFFFLQGHQSYQIRTLPLYHPV